MNTGPSPDEILPRLPGWQDAAWCELDGGLSNRTYRLDKGDRSAVLKIDAEPREAPYNTRHQEAAVQRVAANAGLANEVLHVEEGIYLTEYVAGVVWRPATFGEAGSLERLAVALRRLHALPLCGRSFDAAFAARGYAARIDRHAAVVATCMAIIESMPPPRQRRLCHNDLVAENILSIPEVRFLDWEFACDNDPLFDLATVVEHHGLDRGQAQRLLDAYFDDEAKRPLAALEEQQRLYCALLWLWLAAREDSPQADLDRAASRLATSCS